MKFLFQLNFILQVIWLIVICAGVFQPILLLYAAIVIGFNHLVFSFIILIGDGTSSKLFRHFVISIIYLVLFFMIVNENINIESFLGNTVAEMVYYVGMGIPVLLAIHFWYITYTHFNPFRSLEHSVFDL